MDDDRRILLHACCGPCSLEPVRLLREEGFEPVIFWYNPNIQPVAEHDHRLAVLRAWAAQKGIQLLEAPYDPGAWETYVAPHGLDRVSRCGACYALRLDSACEMAREQGIARVSTTLAVSPYQLFEVCLEELRRAASAYGLEAVQRDFRPHYPEATRRSRELGMYRQNYCGCRFSAAEAALERIERRDARRAARAHAGA